MKEEVVHRIGFELAKTQFKLKNKGSYLGILWYLLEPISIFIILLLISSAFISTDSNRYPLYLLIGIIMFNFLTKATNQAIVAIHQNANLIKSMNINTQYFIESTIFEAIFTHLIEFILIIIALIYYNIPIYTLLYYIPILCIFTLFVTGISYILATLGVFILDTQSIWRIISRLLWFATPIFYTLRENTLSHQVNIFNPLFYFIDITRGIFIHDQIYYQSLYIIFLISIFTYILGKGIFNKYKPLFAEEL